MAENHERAPAAPREQAAESRVEHKSGAELSNETWKASSSTAPDRGPNTAEQHLPKLERHARLELEKHRHDEKKWFYSILDVLPAFIWVKDDKNNIVYANKRAAEARGVTREELEGRSTYDIYPDDASAYFR